MSLTAAEEAQTRELLAQQAAILSLADSEATIISKLGATKVNLSQLPTASSIADADILLVRQGTTDKSVAGSIVKAYAGATVDASTTVKGIVELTTDAEVAAGTDTTRAVTSASRRADKATAASDPTFADNSTKTASTNWVRGAMLAIATAAGFVISLATNGYIKFPSWLGGLIIEWGSVTQTGGTGYTTSNFPLTFPTACFSICGSARSTTSVGSESLEFGTVTTSTFQNLTINSTNTGFNATINWIAIGY